MNVFIRAKDNDLYIRSYRNPPISATAFRDILSRYPHSKTAIISLCLLLGEHMIYLQIEYHVLQANWWLQAVKYEIWFLGDIIFILRTIDKIYIISYVR